MNTELDKFGKFIMTNLRDEAIEHFDGLTQGKWKAPALAKLQSDIASLSEEQRAIVRRCVVKGIDVGIHAFLFKLQKNLDFENDIQVHVDGKNIAELSDGLQGEPFGEDGWQAKFSKFGEGTEKA